MISIMRHTKVYCLDKVCLHDKLHEPDPLTSIASDLSRLSPNSKVILKQPDTIPERNLYRESFSMVVAYAAQNGFLLKVTSQNDVDTLQLLVEKLQGSLEKGYRIRTASGMTIKE